MTKEDCLLQKDLLIEENYGLVHYMARLKYRNDHELDYDERVGIGSIALIKAIRSYDPDKNSKLSAYVCRCVDNALQNAFRGTRKYAHDASTDEPVYGEEDDVRMVDILISDAEPEEDAIESIVHDTIQTGVRDAISKLDERGQLVIKSYYGIGCEQLSQHQIADIVGCSQVHVSRLIRNYTKKLKSLIDVNLIHYL